MVEQAVSVPEKGTEQVPTLRMGEIGYTGLNLLNGHLYEQADRSLRWPCAIHTYKKMENDSSIYPALDHIEMAASRVQWLVKAPKGKDTEKAGEVLFFKQMMNDMEHSWYSFIRSAVSHYRYGFAPHEIVLRKRLKVRGSKYDDGLTGVRKLAIRAQDTISEWGWDGRELLWLKQRVIVSDNTAGTNTVSTSSSKTSEKIIPAKKILLFRNKPSKDNPEGTSPLNACFRDWKFKCALEENEAIGVSSDLKGLGLLKLNPRYMAEGASAADKEVYEYWKRIMQGLHNGEQSNLIVPSLKDEQGNEMIAEFDLLAANGSKAYDVGAIIERYNKRITTTLMAQSLILGQSGSGSYSLAENLSSVTQLAVESILLEIKDVLNNHLVPLLYDENKWDKTDMVEFDFDHVAKMSMDDLSKFLQRVGAVGLLKKDARTINWIYEQAGAPIPFEDETLTREDIEEELTGNSSRSGDGMEEGMGSGTGNSDGGSGDGSTSNTENN